MKREFENEMEDELLSEYDFSELQGGVRGKYVERYRSGTNIILLDPDVAQAFPNDEAVNEALRLLLKIAQRQQPNNSPMGEIGRSAIYVTGDREGEE
ncbi:MAG: hypothetical protein LH628_26640 [Microcoleus sp. CAN_BIN18]|nr:hypothetical protein [Microcoleus sp. CAN_BIN18]